MAPMRAPYGGNLVGVARRREPVMNGSADATALNGRIARPMMARHQQHDPIAARDRVFECPVDRCPGGVEIHTVKIEHPVGLHRSTAQPLVPAAVECPLTDRNRSTRSYNCRLGGSDR